MQVTDLATNSTTITNTITIDNNATDPVLYVQVSIMEAWEGSMLFAGAKQDI